MNSHSIEISIAECVEEMVRDQNPLPFFLLFFTFFYFLFLFLFLSYIKFGC